MTDPSFDELASAHLDGATTPAEAARIAADPALQARVEELRAIRAAIADVPAPDPARRDTAISAALAAFADDPDEAEADATLAVPALRSLPARRGPSPTALRLLGAAAAVALLVLLAPVLGRLAGSGSDDEASFQSTGDAIESSPDAAAEGLDSGGAPTTTAAIGGGDLGSFDDLDALVAAIVTESPGNEFRSATGTATDGQPASPACVTDTDTNALAEVTRPEIATATVADDPVFVIVRRAADGSRTLDVYRTADCSLLTRLPL